LHKWQLPDMRYPTETISREKQAARVLKYPDMKSAPSMVIPNGYVPLDDFRFIRPDSVRLAPVFARSSSNLPEGSSRIPRTYQWRLSS